MDNATARRAGVSVRELYGPVAFAPGVVVGEHCTFGFPKESRVSAWQQRTGEEQPCAGKPVRVGERCILFNQAIIYEGVSIDEDCVIEDRVRIGYDSQIGPRSRLVYGAYLCDRVTVGADTRIAGFVCDGAVIGDRSTVMGELVHEYSRPHEGWWEIDEEPPIVETDCVVGYGARVVGGVRIGPCSYIAAGAVVTKNVPSEHVVTGINVQTPASQWPGPRLQSLIQHWSEIRRPQ